MARRGSDIRRIIARLGGIEQEDLDQILLALDEREAAEVRSLLAGEGANSTPPSSVAPVFDAPNAFKGERPALSAWLTDLLIDKAQTGSTIAPAALSALRSCSAELWPGVDWRLPPPRAVPIKARRSFRDLLTQRGLP